MDNIVYKSSLTNRGSVMEEPITDITNGHTYMCTTSKCTVTDGVGIYNDQFIVEFTVETIFGEALSFRSFTSKRNWRKNPADLGSLPLQIVFERLSNDAKTAQIYSITELIGGVKMKISEVKDCVKTLIKKGVIPELGYRDSGLFTYSEERIRNEIDEIMKRNSLSNINNFIDGNMLDKTPSIDAQSKQKVKRIWTKIHDVNWKSWKYVRVRSINVHLRDIIDLLGDPSLVSFMYNQGWSDDAIYEVYRKAIISYVYSDYRPEKKTLIKIIQIMLQMMCVDILGEDILVDEAYTKQIVTKESYPWNFLSDIGIDIQDCFDIKNDIREELTETITNNIKLLPREAESIKLRYIDMLTFSNVGKELGVSGKRAADIVAKALRKICHPSRLNIIRNILYRYSDDICKQAFAKLGYSGSNICGSLNVLREIKRYKRVNTGHELASIVEGNTVYFKSFIDGTFLGEIEKLIGIANRVAMEENTGANKVNVYTTLTLEELNLSVRAFNCLKRVGVKTVGDIISMTEEDLMCVRNLGKRSRDEIISVIEGLGLKLKESEW